MLAYPKRLHRSRYSFFIRKLWTITFGKYSFFEMETMYNRFERQERERSDPAMINNNEGDVSLLLPTSPSSLFYTISPSNRLLASLSRSKHGLLQEFICTARFVLASLQPSSKQSATWLLACPKSARNFSSKPESWPHGTPLLQTLKDSAILPRFVRYASTFWSGWENVLYLFALYVSTHSTDSS